MTTKTRKIHAKNFGTLKAAAADRKRLCLACATNRVTGEEAALICVVNYAGDEVQLIPIARMLDDPEAVMDEFRVFDGDPEPVTA